MRVDELGKDDLLRLKQVYMMAVCDIPPTYGELAAADDFIDDETIKRIYGCADLPEGFHIPEHEARFEHSAKVMLPAPGGQTFEGIWVLLDDSGKKAYEADVSGERFECVLDNASIYWRGLYPGEVMPLVMNGKQLPEVPYEWIAERFEPASHEMDDDGDDDLAYCPFCGNEHPEIYGDGDTWGVYCDFCNASIEGYVSREYAVKHWNHRYNPDQGGE